MGLMDVIKGQPHIYSMIQDEKELKVLLQAKKICAKYGYVLVPQKIKK